MSVLATKPLKVAVVDGQAPQEVARLFAVRNWKVTASIDEADLVVLTGGADVGPELYGETQLKTTHTNPARDMAEHTIYTYCQKVGKPMVGICRGGQFLNVMNGGKMWQDVDHHGLPHPIKDKATGRTILVTSSHHQMMIPSITGEPVAFANKSTYFAGYGRAIELKDKEREWDNHEVIWYPLTKSLCYQPHPEEGKIPEQFYFFELLARFFRFQVSTSSILGVPGIAATGVQPESGVPFDDPVDDVLPFDPDPVG